MSILCPSPLLFPCFFYERLFFSLFCNPFISLMQLQGKNKKKKAERLECELCGKMSWLWSLGCILVNERARARTTTVIWGKWELSWVSADQPDRQRGPSVPHILISAIGIDSGRYHGWSCPSAFAGLCQPINIPHCLPNHGNDPLRRHSGGGGCRFLRLNRLLALSCFHPWPSCWGLFVSVCQRLVCLGHVCISGMKKPFDVQLYLFFNHYYCSFLGLCMHEVETQRV